MRLKSEGDLLLDALQVLHQLGPLTKAELVTELGKLFSYQRKDAAESINVGISTSLIFERPDGKLALNP